MSKTRSGACLCGAVTFDADIDAPRYHACHCETCRRWGGPAMATGASALRVADGAPVKSFISSDYGERVFCAQCGTHLFWKMQDESMIYVWIGTLKETVDMNFDLQIFVDSKPGHYSFANETKSMTGAEVYAAATGEL